MTGPLRAAEIRARKGGRRLAMLTAYDYPTARALDECGLDILLVGDSLGEVELGFDTTRAVTPAMMAHHVRAVRNGVARTHVCGDMPAGAYRSPAEAVETARALVAAGADSVKLEGALIPHEAAERIAADARALDGAGCFAIVIEAVPAELAARITGEVACPTIGIAAGPECDGQVLVSTDLIGQVPDPPRFVKPKANVYAAVVRAGREFADEVRGADAGGEGIARTA